MVTSDVAVEPVTPDPPPWDRRTVLRQGWEELAYFHWAYEPDTVQALLPDDVRVDTHDGAAWVGLIPFEMRNVALGPTPPVPVLGSFVEINVRTYVVDARGRRAVWFFSLDVPRTPIVGVARTAFSLPYCWAAAGHEVTAPGDGTGADPHAPGARHRYWLRRRWPRRTSGTRSSMAFTVGDAIADDAVSDFDHFVSARWALLTQRRGQTLRGAVDHPRWPLHDVHDVEISGDVVQAAGLPEPAGEPLARYSPGVQVRVGWLQPAGREPAGADGVAAASPEPQEQP